MTWSEQKIAVLKNKPSKQTHLQPLEHGRWTVIPMTCQGWGTNAHYCEQGLEYSVPGYDSH